MRKLQLGELSAHVTGGADGHGDGDGPVLVLLHGFGAPGTDLVPLAEELQLPDSMRCVFPMAPLLLETGAPESRAARAWWLIDLATRQRAAMTGQFDALADEDPDGLDSARSLLESLLQAVETELSARPEQIVLGGFSQGAMLATETVLQGARPFAGLAILSGTLIRQKRWRELAPKRRELPVFMSHGMADPILPFVLAEQLEELLRGAELAVDFTPFSGGHGIPSLVLQRLGAFARRVVS